MLIQSGSLHSTPGYPHSFRDTTDDAPAYTRPHFGAPMSSTLPRRPHPYEPKSVQQQPQQPLQPSSPLPHIPFQRANNAYWTLQLRKPTAGPTPAQHQQQSHDDASTMTRPAPSARPIEELYSTPNKIRSAAPAPPTTIRSAEQLRPTAQGFGHYFSPIAKSTAAAATAVAPDVGHTPIDPRAGHGFRTSTPTKSSPGDGQQPGTPLGGTLTDELRHKLHAQQLQQQKLQSYADGSYQHHHQQQSNAATASSPLLFGSASSLSSGRSTPSFARPQLEPQQSGSTDQLASTSCSDRLGTPKTTLLDFKKLLLAKATGKTAPTSKPSAVEQLRLAKAAAAAATAAAAAGTQQQQQTGGATVSSAAPPVTATGVAALNASMSIIDLSGSPKTFANRRMIRQGNFGSPSKSGAAAAAAGTGGGDGVLDAPNSVGKHHMSPRAAWKFANAPYRTDVMSTAIPEAHSEEDTSNGSTGSNASAVTTIDRSEATVASADSPSPTASTASSDAGTGVSSSSGSSASASSSAAAASTTALVAADTINLKSNIFLQAEENNFMRGEIGTKSLSRAQMAQARSQFLTGLGATQAPATVVGGGGQSAPGSPLMHLQQHQRLAQFKNGHYTGLSPTRTLPTTAAAATMPAPTTASLPQFRAQTEAILDTSGDGAPTPSLETAL